MEIVLQVANNIVEKYKRGIFFKTNKIMEYIKEVRIATRGTLPVVRCIENPGFADDVYCIEIGAEYVWGIESQKEFFKALYETWMKYEKIPIHVDNKEYLKALNALFNSIASTYDTEDINENIHKLLRVYWSVINTPGAESKQIQILLVLASFMFYDRRSFEGKRCIEKAISIAVSQDFYSPVWKYYSFRAGAFSLAAIDSDYGSAIKYLEAAIDIASHWGIVDFQVDAMLEIINIFILIREYDYSIEIIKKLRSLIEGQDKYSDLYNALLRLENQLLSKKIENLEKEYSVLEKEYHYLRSSFFAKLGESVIFCVKKIGPSVLSYTIGSCLSGDTIINQSATFSNNKIFKVQVNNG